MTNQIPIFNIYQDGILQYVKDIKSHPASIITLIIDLVIVIFLIYKLIKIVRETRAWQLIKGIAFLLIATFLSELFNLYILNSILTSFMIYGVILLIVIFQPELRRGLEQLRNKQIIKVFWN